MARNARHPTDSGDTQPQQNHGTNPKRFSCSKSYIKFFKFFLPWIFCFCGALYLSYVFFRGRHYLFGLMFFVLGITLLTAIFSCYWKVRQEVSIRHRNSSPLPCEMQRTAPPTCSLCPPPPSYEENILLDVNASNRQPGNSNAQTDVRNQSVFTILQSDLTVPEVRPNQQIIFNLAYDQNIFLPSPPYLDQPPSYQEVFGDPSGGETDCVCNTTCLDCPCPPEERTMPNYDEPSPAGSSQVFSQVCTEPTVPLEGTVSTDDGCLSQGSLRPQDLDGSNNST